MAVDMLGRMSTDDDSPVCSEADVEAYTTLEIKTGEYLVSMMEEVKIRQMGTICGFLSQRLLVTLRMILDYLRMVLSAVGCYVVRGGNTFPIVGISILRLSLRPEERVVCVTLMNVAHVLRLSHRLLSLRRIADARKNTSVPERASE